MRVSMVVCVQKNVWVGVGVCMPAKVSDMSEFD